jgi:hypothetical protein
MQPISRKKRIVLLAVFLAYALWSVLIQALTDRYGSRPSAIDADALVIVRWVLFGFSIYGFVLLWLLNLGRLPMFLREHPSRFVPRPEVRLLLYSYLFIVAPLLYARLLPELGASFPEYLLFAGASILMALLWGIYDLRKR